MKMFNTRKLWKAVSLGLCGAALTVMLAGCGADNSSSADKGVLKVGVTNFADTLEPTQNFFGWVVMRYGLGECLTKFDDKMNVQPWLAESWSISDDHTTWTFKIREGVKFSNGNPLTAEAVKASIERAFAKNNRAATFFKYKEIKAEGQTLTIVTEKPMPNMPGFLADPLFIIVDTSAEGSRDFAKEGPICTGPYMVKNYTKALAEMVRNPNYWDGEVPFDAVNIHTIDDPNTRAMALQSGEIDMAINISAGDLALFGDKSKFYISAIPSLRDVLGRLNQAPGRILADKAVRQALLRSLDRETYCKVLLKDTFTAGGPLIPPSMDYDFPNLKDPNGYDPDSAEDLLEKAGWKMGKDGVREKDGKKLELDFIFYSGRAELPLFAEATQADASGVGFKINLKNVDYNVLDGIGIRGEYDILISNVLAAQAGDPEVFVNMYWKTNRHSGDPAKGSNPQNGSGFSNARYDELSDKLAVEFDPAKRREIVIEMEKIILEEAGTVIFGYPQTNMVSNLTVTGAEIQPCDYYWLTKDTKPAK